MEYVVLATTHPTWLNLKLPGDAQRVLGYRPRPDDPTGASRTISFVSRGPGVARVLPTYAMREALAVESLRGRFLAAARLSAPLLFSLPAPVLRHLEVELVSPPGRSRSTDDTVMWFLPASEYYAFRRAERTEPAGEPGERPAVHLYLSRATLPPLRGFAQLAEVERQIERDEWAPGVEALQQVLRGRRT